MIIRITKLMFVFFMALLALFITFNNIQDYFLSLKMVEMVLSMKTIFPDSSLTYRAISLPALHHAALITIISMEALTGLFCLYGFVRMWRNLHNSAAEFNQAKNTAIIGLSIGFIGWQFLFMTVGGEWFGMWMSNTAVSAIQAAFQIFITYLGVLIYLVHKDDELTS